MGVLNHAEHRPLQSADDMSVSIKTPGEWFDAASDGFIQPPQIQIRFQLVSSI